MKSGKFMARGLVTERIFSLVLSKAGKYSTYFSGTSFVHARPFNFGGLFCHSIHIILCIRINYIIEMSSKL
jgi:hypothetical protein